MTTLAASGDKQLISAIVEEINGSRDRLIPFHRFMELCLYHPQFGYYMKENPKIGTEGDFYTSASIGTLMGEMLAVAFAQYWRGQQELSVYAITEWGGGTGRLAEQVMDELQLSFPDIYAKLQYTIVDTSPYHRDLQSKLAQKHNGVLITVQSPEAWFAAAALPDGAIVFANELLDAFAVHRLQYRNGQFHDGYVGFDTAQGAFYEELIPVVPNGELARALDQRKLAARMQEGQWIEWNPMASAWIAQIANKLTDGLLVLIDYGEEEEQLYAPSRMNGTLLCYFRHQAHDNPYVNIGQQDITAHVDFTACMEAGVAAGLQVETFETQQKFLIRLGIIERLQAHTESDPFHPIVKRNRAIRQLLLGDSMADVFKVVSLTKRR